MTPKSQNISFFPEDMSKQDFPVFRGIWKVNADARYHAHHDKGFADSGLFFTTSGTGSMELHDRKKIRTHLLGPATVFLVDSSDPCSYGFHSGTSWDFYFFHFKSGGKLAENLEFKTLYGLKYIHNLVNICEEIIDEFSRKRAGYVLKANSLLTDFLVAMMRNMSEPMSEKEREIEKIIQWMKQNTEEKLVSDRIVEMSGMGRTALFRAFKKTTGVSPGSYFMNLKLEAARHMLESSDRKIKHITEQLNFYDEYYFSRQFKRRYGMPPSEYRRMKQPYQR